MKKFLNGLLFFIAVVATVFYLYFVVTQSDVSYPAKLIFSGFILILALIVAVYSVVSVKRENAEILHQVAMDLSDGIAVFEDGELIFRNKKFEIFEEKEGIPIVDLINNKEESENFYISIETVKIKKCEYVVIKLLEKVQKNDFDKDVFSDFTEQMLEEKKENKEENLTEIFCEQNSNETEKNYEENSTENLCEQDSDKIEENREENPFEHSFEQNSVETGKNQEENSSENSCEKSSDEIDENQEKSSSESSCEQNSIETEENREKLI